MNLAAQLNTAGRTFTVDGVTFDNGEVISVDGTSGRVYVGEVPARSSAVVRHSEG